MDIPKGNSPSSPIYFLGVDSLLVSCHILDVHTFVICRSYTIDFAQIYVYICIYVCVCVKKSVYTSYICTFVNPFLFKINPLRVLHKKTPRHVQQHCAVRDVILIKVSQFHVPHRHPIHDPDRLKVSKVVIR